MKDTKGYEYCNWGTQTWMWTHGAVEVQTTCTPPGLHLLRKCQKAHLLTLAVQHRRRGRELFWQVANAFHVDKMGSDEYCSVAHLSPKLLCNQKEETAIQLASALPQLIIQVGNLHDMHTLQLKDYVPRQLPKDLWPTHHIHQISPWLVSSGSIDEHLDCTSLWHLTYTVYIYIVIVFYEWNIHVRHPSCSQIADKQTPEHYTIGSRNKTTCITLQALKRTTRKTLAPRICVWMCVVKRCKKDRFRIFCKCFVYLLAFFMLNLFFGECWLSTVTLLRLYTLAFRHQDHGDTLQQCLAASHHATNADE